MKPHRPHPAGEKTSKNLQFIDAKMKKEYTNRSKHVNTAKKVISHRS
jgi:hypothetical protein